MERDERGEGCLCQECVGHLTTDFNSRNTVPPGEADGFSTPILTASELPRDSQPQKGFDPDLRRGFLNIAKKDSSSAATAKPSSSAQSVVDKEACQATSTTSNESADMPMFRLRPGFLNQLSERKTSLSEPAIAHSMTADMVSKPVSEPPTASPSTTGAIVSKQVGGEAKVAEQLMGAVKGKEVRAGSPSSSDPPAAQSRSSSPVGLKPATFSCSKCKNPPGDAQLIHVEREACFKVECQEDCRLDLHRTCFYEAFGTNKKKELKNAICPTDGCRELVQLISLREPGLEKKFEMWLKGPKAEGEKNEKNQAEVQESAPPIKKEKKEKEKKKEKGKGEKGKRDEKALEVDEKELPEASNPHFFSLAAEPLRPKLVIPQPLPVDLDAKPLKKEDDVVVDKYAVKDDKVVNKRYRQKKQKETIQLPELTVAGQRGGRGGSEDWDCCEFETPESPTVHLDHHETPEFETAKPPAVGGTSFPMLATPAEQDIELLVKFLRNHKADFLMNVEERCDSESLKQTMINYLMLLYDAEEVVKESLVYRLLDIFGENAQAVDFCKQLDFFNVSLCDGRLVFRKKAVAPVVSLPENRHFSLESTIPMENAPFLRNFNPEAVAPRSFIPTTESLDFNSGVSPFHPDSSQLSCNSRPLSFSTNTWSPRMDSEHEYRHGFHKELDERPLSSTADNIDYRFSQNSGVLNDAAASEEEDDDSIVVEALPTAPSSSESNDALARELSGLRLDHFDSIFTQRQALPVETSSAVSSTRFSPAAPPFVSSAVRSVNPFMGRPLAHRFSPHSHPDSSSQSDSGESSSDHVSQRLETALSDLRDMAARQETLQNEMDEMYAASARHQEEMQEKERQLRAAQEEKKEAEEEKRRVFLNLADQVNEVNRLSAENEKMARERQAHRIQLAQTIANSNNTGGEVMKAKMARLQKMRATAYSALRHCEMIITKLPTTADGSAVAADFARASSEWTEYMGKVATYINALKEGNDVNVEGIRCPRLPLSGEVLLRDVVVKRFGDAHASANELMTEMKRRLQHTNASLPSHDEMTGVLVRYRSSVPPGTPLPSIQQAANLVADALRLRPPPPPAATTDAWKTTSAQNQKERQVNLGHHECKICLDPVAADEEYIHCQHPACREPFHAECLKQWLSNCPTCPNCKGTFPNPEQYPSLC